MKYEIKSEDDGHALVEGKAIRFGPSRNQEPAASLWKMWVQGCEVYATSRGPGGVCKISVHASGQVHFRIEGKHKQDLAPAMQLGSDTWYHAFELRFLLSDGALSPFGVRKSLKNKTAHLIPVPDGLLLYANLIIGSKGAPLDCPLPTELLPAGQRLWSARLRDGRPAVLVARLLELDSQNRDQIRYMREELRPTVTYSSIPKGDKYIEIHRLHWSPEGGNVILAIPMGEEAFRSEEELLQPHALPTAPRLFTYRNSHSTVDLIAPDGMRVGVLELPEVHKQIELTKGLPSTINLGSLTLRIEPSNLIVGSPFTTSPQRLVYDLKIGGASPRDWGLMIFSRFDGSSLTVEIRLTSASLQNRNLAMPVQELNEEEEIVISIPPTELILASSLDLPTASTELTGRFTLRDKRRSAGV